MTYDSRNLPYDDISSSSFYFSCHNQKLRHKYSNTNLLLDASGGGVTEVPDLSSVIDGLLNV